MRHQILVIDDEWAERRADYKNFERSVNSMVQSFELDFDFLPDPLELLHYLNSKRYSAVIVDAKLDGNWTDDPLRKLIPLIDNEIPIALVSSRWDDTIVEDVNVAWNKPNCKTFLRWSEIIGQEDGGRRRAAFLLTKIISEYMQMDLTFDIEPNEALRILHVSDLQFGPKIVGDLNGLAIHCAEAVLQGWGINPPHIIAITGDIAERGLPDEYNKAYEWLSIFLNRLDFDDPPSRRLLLVPGNHDYCLPFAAAPRVGFREQRKKDDDGRRRELTLSKNTLADRSLLAEYAFRPYVDFAARVTDCPWIEPPGWFTTPCLSWVEGRFRHLGVLFYGLNTNNPVNPYGFSGRRAIPAELASIQRSLLDLQRRTTNPLVTIGLGHHSPVASGGRRADAENLDELEAFLQGSARTHCFLNGHIHKASVVSIARPQSKLLVSTASTLTLPEGERPRDTLRGFSLIDLERNNGSVVNIKVTPFNFHNNQFTSEVSMSLQC